MKLFHSVFGVDNHKKVVDVDGVNATYNKQEGYYDSIYISLKHYPYGSSSSERGYVALSLSKGVDYVTSYLPPSPKMIKEAIQQFRKIIGEA